ncbi:hypothetical protein [Campylobacter concisus]|uniref:hypothetical protein n=1 Tax=Campylobacter concisus TaxID=199 RepID=UPI001CA34E19|nr:hypothetical protein [Campylobacter concisus]MCA6129766.1 hypothetical protein [Campylobacter concisus]MCA6132075.1 hypothetical protein [Campylobacter concisus]
MAGTFAAICTIYNDPNTLKLNFIISNQTRQLLNFSDFRALAGRIYRQFLACSSARHQD